VFGEIGAGTLGTAPTENETALGRHRGTAPTENETALTLAPPRGDGGNLGIRKKHNKIISMVLGIKNFLITDKVQISFLS